MKHLIKFSVIVFFILFCTELSAEQKIAFVDMKFVLNNSKAGKEAQIHLQKVFKGNQDKFIEEEKNLKKKESDLLAKKNILSKEEYKKKTDELRKSVIDYQGRRRTIVDKITKQRADARKQLLDKLNPILSDYIKENGISMLIDKKSVLVGSSDLDITNPVIEKLNKALPSIKLE